MARTSLPGSYVIPASVFTSSCAATLLSLSTKVRNLTPGVESVVVLTLVASVAVVAVPVRLPVTSPVRSPVTFPVNVASVPFVQF